MNKRYILRRLHGRKGSTINLPPCYSCKIFNGNRPKMEVKESRLTRLGKLVASYLPFNEGDSIITPTRSEPGERYKEASPVSNKTISIFGRSLKRHST